MYDNRKAIYLALMFSVFSFIGLPSNAYAEELPLNAQLEEIKNSREKKTTGLQSRSYTTPTYKKDKKDSDQVDDKKSDEQDDKTEAAELTEDQKIWNKYKELADKDTKESDESDKDEDSSEEQENASVDDIEPTESVEEQPKKELTGMAAILQQYKNAQEGKGNMTTRSLGSID